MKIKDSDIYASVGTVVVCALVLLILLYCGMTASHDQAADGIEVSFGYEDDGFGMTEDLSAEATETEPVAAAEPAKPTPAPNVASEPLITQDDESVAIAQEKKRREKEEQERLLAEQRERERLAEEARIAAEKAERKAKRQAEEAAKAEKAKNIASVFGKNAGSGSGTTTGDAMAGNPVGSGVSGGHAWSLAGCSLKGTIPQPAYTNNEEGRIVVNIRVDRNGNVTDAHVNPNLSNITDQTLRNASVNSAKKTKWTTSGEVSNGQITYNFRIK